MTRDQHVFKLKPNSQLYKEKEAFNQELEESIDIAEALAEMYAPVKKERKANANKTRASTVAANDNTAQPTDNSNIRPSKRGRKPKNPPIDPFEIKLPDQMIP